MRHTLLLIAIFSICSCEYEKYPPEKYYIPTKYREVISSFKTNDTIVFTNNRGNLISIVIESIDSTLHNKRGHFINAREYKDISISCKELNNPRQGYDRYNLILINRYPDEDSATFDIRFMDFFTADTTFPMNKRDDTVSANNLIFTNYYLFRPNNYKNLNDTNSLTEIYMTKENGIIAFKNKKGIWWTKVE